MYAHKIHTSCFSSFHGRTPQPAPMTTREVTDGAAEEREKKLFKSHKSTQTLVAVFIIHRRAEEFGGGGWRLEVRVQILTLMRFVTGCHLWLPPTFRHFPGAHNLVTSLRGSSNSYSPPPPPPYPRHFQSDEPHPQK